METNPPQSKSLVGSLVIDPKLGMVGPRFDPLQTREPAGSENKKIK
jgi:hypothetical protein